MGNISERVNQMLGLDVPQLIAWQMGIRAIVVYILGLAMVRIVGEGFIIRRPWCSDWL